MPEDEAKKICMTDIAYVNQLYGCEEIARLQRAEARFINTTIMVSLLGAACSDGLENGRKISGVGGQYNFVAMAHALDDARSVLMCRSTRTKGDEVSSNIVWNYGHTTIPAHLRDIVMTEYGIAMLRGQREKDVIARLLNIADSRFQEELLQTGQGCRQDPPDYEIPEQFRNNTRSDWTGWRPACDRKASSRNFHSAPISPTRNWYSGRTAEAEGKNGFPPHPVQDPCRCRGFRHVDPGGRPALSGADGPGAALRPEGDRRAEADCGRVTGVRTHLITRY